jgi:hypothetical protein
MYRGFNLQVADDAFKGYLKFGRSDRDAHRGAVRTALDSLTDNYGRVIASKLVADWFPHIRAQVFICHAHDNSLLAERLAGFFRYNFDITSFIDSNVWGCADDLLWLIDNQYCAQDTSYTFDYEKRNRSTSHVYMMLSVALTQMLNECECVIFLNTPETLSPRNYIAGNSTESPWIYSELAMTSLIQKRSREDHRGFAKRAMDARADEALRVRYDVKIDHLGPGTRSVDFRPNFRTQHERLVRLTVAF